jgi:hypothetical protein
MRGLTPALGTVSGYPCFFLGGRGRGRGAPGYVLLRSFGRTSGLQTNPSTCSHSDDSGGASDFVPPRTPWSIGYDFLCTCGLCCYMLYVYVI